MDKTTSDLEPKFLAQPFLELSDKSLKIRRNLNITALISIAITLLDVKVIGVTFSGVKTEGLTETKLHIIILAVLLYHFFYFIWCCYDEYWKWRLHLIIETSDDQTKRQTNDSTFSPSQQSVDPHLYSNNDFIGQVYSNIRSAIVSMDKTTDIDKIDYKKQLDLTWERHFKPLIEQDLKRLKRYEDSFKNYHIQEIVRFFIFECGLPVLLALYGTYELLNKLVLVDLTYISFFDALSSSITD